MRNIALFTIAGALLGVAPAHAEAGDLIVRARALIVAPNERSGPVLPAFPGGRVAVDNSYTPELDFTYMATNHVGAELILATTKHHISGRDDLAPVGRLAGTWVLPPTLTLQYHFMPEGHVRPYLGAGVNYTIFYNSKTTDALNTAIGKTHIGLSDSVGYAVQGGVDVDITRRVFANFDIKYIDINTRAHLTTGALQNSVKVHLDPIVAGIGLGMRF